MSTSKHALADAKAVWRTHTLLRAMSGDYLLREQFATDPIQVFCNYVAADRAAGKSAEAANQLVFSVFSSPHLRQWMGDYSRRHGGRNHSRHQFAQQFARAAASARDPLVTLALVRCAATGGDFELPADFFRAVLAAIGSHGGLVSSGTEMSPGVTATEMSPGGTGTEMSPGAASLAGRVAAELASAVRFAGELRRVQSAEGTEMSPGVTATEMSPGATGTEMSPGTLRLAQSLAAALRRAERFSDLLHRADGGTEMSPGVTATEMSPGATTATEMSPGASRLSAQLAAEIRIASRIAAALLSAEGTEMSPGATSTERSPGGTEMSPGKFGAFDALAAALRRAQLFSVELQRAAEGTEMSPGTATNMSPGVTATEMSPGAARLGIAERLSAELASAARFGSELLRADGTEMSPGATGTEMSPGVRGLTEGLVRAVLGAQRLSQLLVRTEGGTEMSPGTATEMSTGVTATNMSPGARPVERLAAEINTAVRYASALWKSAADGTEMSPGGGTEMSPGVTATEMSPGAVNLAKVFTASVRRAQLFLAEIVRFAEGTDISPGTEVGTNISPGTGTMIDPGALAAGGLWGMEVPAVVSVALDALVRYAIALRRQGALDASGLEIG